MISAMPNIINIGIYASVSKTDPHFVDENFQTGGVNIQSNCG
jgi:hypothetical protein